ncbi:GD10031 [Drosophila simulans]|uniref:Translationally-controlled tumor protein homolog n=1 Tax=Drosophila simulans TaxID=7240 RepID=B4NW17_DROSI|nr:GD10031 [Drosophila simulans]
MKIYKDIITGDEMFADTFKMKLVDDVIYEVYGKLITRQRDDIRRLTERFAFGDKKLYTLYLKDYMKKVLAELEEKSPDQVDIFKTNMNKAMTDILGRFKELQFFTGESMDCDGMVALVEYRKINGDSVPVLMSFKHGLEEEKC